MTRQIISALFLVLPLNAFGGPAPNVVTQWAGIVQHAIHNSAAPRSAGSAEVLHTMVHLAVYDAVVAIEGGYQPYAAHIRRAPHADVNAAVATAAYVAARARVAVSSHALLDQEYANALAAIPEGSAKQDGIRIGMRAARAILELRAADNFDNVVLYQCSQVPPPAGEFEPDAGCPSAPSSPQPVDAKVGQIQPYTIKNLRRFTPGPPPALSSNTYTRDFVEVRDYGRVDSAMRSPEQTDIAYFWSENPYVHWNRNLNALAVANNLDVLATARLFALVHTTTADAVIVGFASKYRYGFWRPRTAIPRADADGNDATDADPAWRPLLAVNHPEYPSGHAFWTTALVNAVAHFFGTDRITWTVTTSKIAVPKVERTERTYDSLNALNTEVLNARVWAGLHWRDSMSAGAAIGDRVSRHVGRHFFRPQD